MYLKKALLYVLAALLLLSSCTQTVVDDEKNDNPPENEIIDSQSPENDPESETENPDISSDDTETPDAENESTEPEASGPEQAEPDSSENEPDNASETDESDNTNVSDDQNEPEEPEKTDEPDASESTDTVEIHPIPLTLDEEPDWDAPYNQPAISYDNIQPGVICNNVYVGYDGWFFYGDSIKDYSEDSSVSSVRMKRIISMMSDRLEWCEENGIKLYFVIAPNKNTIYPEYMPESVKKAENKTVDAVLDAIRANTNLTVIDTREGLLAAKEQYPDENLFYKLDTHWNNHGGFAAYSQIMDVIRQDFPNAVKWSRDDYQIDYFKSYFKDQAYYLGWYDTMQEDGPVYTRKDGHLPTLTKRRDSGPYGQFFHAYIHEDGYRDKTDYCIYQNDYVPDAPSVYVIRDSFSIALVPFIKDSFSTSVFNWTLSFNQEDILKNKPDIVIMEIVERSLLDFLSGKTFS